MAMEQVKKDLRSVLMSSKEGVPIDCLLRDFKEFVFKELQYQKMGFNSLEDFLRSVPDAVRIGRNKHGEVMCYGVGTEEIAHLERLIKNQKVTKKKRRNIKVPAPSRRRTFYNRPPLLPTPPTPPAGLGQGGFPNKSPFPGNRRQKPYPRYKRGNGRENFQVVVDVKSSSTPRRSVRFTGPNRALTSAMNAANDDRQTERVKFGEKFEVPPRFRNLGKENQPQTPINESQKQRAVKETQPGHATPRRSFTKPSDERVGNKYLDRFIKYAVDNDVDWSYERMTVKLGKDTGFTSLVNIDGKQYGSGDVYKSKLEADCAAAREVCIQLNLSLDSSPKPVGPTSTVPEEELKVRVREILVSRPNGVFSTRLPVMYKEKYKEEPPPDLEKRAKRWKDIVQVDENASTGLSILYVAKEQVQPEVKVTDNTATPVPDPKLSIYINLQIPPGVPLAIRERVVVYMTYMKDFTYLCVQKEDSPCEEIDAKSAQLQHNPVPDLSDLRVGSCVAAAYNGGWSRAEVQNISDDKINLLYVDYGNEGQGRIQDVRWLTEELAQYPVQAVYCTLWGVMPLEGEEFSEESIKEFVTYVQDQALTAITKEIIDDGVCEVELYLENDPISINQKLIDRGLVRAPTPEEMEEEGEDDDSEPETLILPEDNQWDVYVSYINSSTNSVMIRLVGEQYSDLLEEYESKLEEAFHAAGENITPIQEDQVYVAYVDELYHRVRVLSKADKWVEVFFLDHGDTDKVIPDQLRYLDPAINKALPYQVIEVSLYGLEDPSISENVSALEMVFDMALGKTCVAEVVSRERGISLILYDTSGEQDININDVIKQDIQKAPNTDTVIQNKPELVNTSEVMETKSASSKSSSATTSPTAAQRPDSSKQVFPSSVSTHLHIDTKGSQKSTTTPKTTPKTSPGHSPSKSQKSAASPSAKSKQKYYWPSPAKAKPVKKEKEEEEWETESEEEEEETPRNHGSVAKHDGTIAKHNVAKHGRSVAKHDGKRDENSNLNITGANQSQTDLQSDVAQPQASLEDSMKSLDLQENSQAKLYTWGKPVVEDETVDDWDVMSYHQRQVPPRAKVPNPKDYWDVHVAMVFDPTNFICIPFENMVAVDQMLRDMIEYYNSEDTNKVLSVEDLKLGHLYAGHQNGAWYRVIINRVLANDLVSAYLCDFGEYTVMAIEEIKPLPLKFWGLPLQAYRCKLHGIQPSKGAALWSEAAKYKFRSMAHNHSLVALVINVTDDVVSMRLVDTSGNEDICLDEVLLSAGFADKIRSS